MRARDVALVTLAIVVSIAGLRLAAGVLVPIILSVLVALALDPFVRAVQRVIRNRSIASGVVVAGLTLLLGASAYNLRDDVAAAADYLPEATAKLRRELREMRRTGDGPLPLDALTKAADNIEAAASEAAGNPPAPPTSSWAGLGLREWLVVGSMSVIGFTGQLVLLVFFVYFLLAADDLFKRKIVRLFGPALSARRITVEVLDNIHHGLRRLVLVVLATNVIVGIASYVAFRMLGLANPGIWAIVAAALNTIPYVGGAVTSAIIFLVALLQFDGMQMAAVTAGAFLVITSVEGWFLTPWWMGRAARLNNAAVFAGLLFWGWLWGAWGMLLAYPILLVMKTIADHVDGLHAVRELLGE